MDLVEIARQLRVLADQLDPPGPPAAELAQVIPLRPSRARAGEYVRAAATCGQGVE